MPILLGLNMIKELFIANDHRVKDKHQNLRKPHFFSLYEYDQSVVLNLN